MMAISEAEILSEIISPQGGGLSSAAAHAILELDFSESTRNLIRDLLQAQNKGSISEEEQSNLQKYLRVGQLIDLLQAKARLSLAHL